MWVLHFNQFVRSKCSHKVLLWFALIAWLLSGSQSCIFPSKNCVLVCLLVFVLGERPQWFCSANFPESASTHTSLFWVQLHCPSQPVEGSTQAGRDNPHCANLRETSLWDATKLTCRKSDLSAQYEPGWPQNINKLAFSYLAIVNGLTSLKQQWYKLKATTLGLGRGESFEFCPYFFLQVQTCHTSSRRC